MYPSDLCDYLFYTDVFADDGHIYAKVDYQTWLLFQRMAIENGRKRGKLEFGVSFSFDVVTPERLDESARVLNLLRELGIRHYGLLTVLAFQSNYSSTISSMRGIIAKLKELQRSDPEAKTVLAFGPYEHSADFMRTIKAEFTNVVNTFMADIVIAITSTGWLASDGHCKAAPPNSINTDNQGHNVLLCEDDDFTGGPKNYLGDPIYAYGVFSSASKALTWSEYKDSLASKFRKALSHAGKLRKDSTWLLYNVHNEGPGTDCPEPPFTVLKHFRAAVKDAYNITQR
ncbi:hypothetical protein MTO96_005079 [Rhipicephalus appendiculatus]